MEKGLWEESYSGIYYSSNGLKDGTKEDGAQA